MNPQPQTDRSNDLVSWREAGTGPPVLFLHGLGGTRASWGPQLRELSDEFRCIAWDMPGYGDSRPIEPLTFPAVADRLSWFIDSLGLERPDVVGLSLGGMHALHTAIGHPDAVGRLVIADSSPAFGLDGTSAEAWTATRLESIDRGGTPAEIAATVLDSITEVELVEPVRTEVVDAFASIPTPSFRAAVQCLPSHDVRDRLATINHKTLVVVGALDQETPVSYSEAIHAGLADSELVVLDGVGHLSPTEDPTSFNQSIRRFLTQERTRG